MYRKINKVAFFGSGVMGSGIACHFANIGVEVILLDLINTKFGSWEMLKDYRLTADIWSVDEGHLTPTMKLKRSSILEKYRELFESIYS